MKSNKPISENAKDEIIDKYLDGATNKKISKRLGISQSTVERVIHERFEIKVKEQLSYECPSIIGIDEHTIHKGYKFATTIADLTHHRVYDVIEGKSRNLVESKLMSYKGRDRHSKAVFPESKNSGGQVPRYKIGVVSLYGILQTSPRRSKME